MGIKKIFLICLSFALLVGIPKAYSTVAEKYHQQFQDCDAQLSKAPEINNSNVDTLASLCEIAADNGVWQAQLYLAGLYQMGKNGKIKSFPKNYQKALEYYTMYLAQFPENTKIYAMFSFMYEEGGYGIARNPNRAAYYLEKSKENNHAVSQP